MFWDFCRWEWRTWSLSQADLWPLTQTHWSDLGPGIWIMCVQVSLSPVWGHRLWFLSDVMDLPPRSRTGGGSDSRFFPPCELPQLFSVWFNPPCWVYYRKMLPLSQTALRQQSYDADSALPLITESTIYLVADQQADWTSSKPPTQPHREEKPSWADMTFNQTQPLVRPRSTSSTDLRPTAGKVQLHHIQQHER